MKIMQKLSLALITAFVMFGFSAPALAQGLAVPSDTTGQYSCSRNEAAEQCLKENPIIKWINFFVNLLAAVIFVGATAMLIYGGVQYASAADSPQRVEAAKKTISSVLLGLVAFFFLYAFLQWLIPGGIF